MVGFLLLRNDLHLDNNSRSSTDDNGQVCLPENINTLNYISRSVISPIALTRNLQPLLYQTAAGPNSDVRIVVVRTFTHRTRKLTNPYLTGRFRCPSFRARSTSLPQH